VLTSTTPTDRAFWEAALDEEPDDALEDPGLDDPDDPLDAEPDDDGGGSVAGTRPLWSVSEAPGELLLLVMA
jgi:hypothetical protein